jgi:hypothetical protein
VRERFLKGSQAELATSVLAESASNAWQKSPASKTQAKRLRHQYWMDSLRSKVGQAFSLPYFCHALLVLRNRSLTVAARSGPDRTHRLQFGPITSLTLSRAPRLADCSCTCILEGGPRRAALVIRFLWEEEKAALSGTNAVLCAENCQRCDRSKVSTMSSAGRSRARAQSGAIIGTIRVFESAYRNSRCANS